MPYYDMYFIVVNRDQNQINCDLQILHSRKNKSALRKIELH